LFSSFLSPHSFAPVGSADWEIDLDPGVSRDSNARGESASDRENREPLRPFGVRTRGTLASPSKMLRVYCPLPWFRQRQDCKFVQMSG